MNSRLPIAEEKAIEHLRALGRRLRSAALGMMRGSEPEQWSSVAREGGDGGDTLYAIDRVSEDALLQAIEEMAFECPCVLVSEGFEDGGDLRLQCRGGATGDAAAIRLIVDPIDGTRGLMSDKRSGWVLCAAALDRGPETSLSDVIAAVQTEIPTSKQWRADQLWAIRGKGVFGEWEDIRAGARGPLHPRPSRAPDLHHGFASFAKFFPGARDVLARIEEELIRRVVYSKPKDATAASSNSQFHFGGPDLNTEPPDSLAADSPQSLAPALVFEDQYISTGGQLYEMAMGRDRFIADLRPLMNPILRGWGLPRALCCHPYDLASALVAQEAGVILTDASGEPLDYPLDTQTDCAWIAYANPRLRELIEPVLLELLSNL